MLITEKFFSGLKITRCIKDYFVNSKLKGNAVFKNRRTL